jgi:hypothetical protein
VFAGARQTVPLKESGVGPCLRQVLDRKTSERSFGTLVVVRTAREYTIDVAVDNQVEGIVEVDHPCNPFEGTCTGLPSASLGDRMAVGGGNRNSAV